MSAVQRQKNDASLLFFLRPVEAQSLSGESGAAVRHVMVFSPFSSAQSAVVMDGGGGVRSGRGVNGKHEDKFLVIVILGFKVTARWVGLVVQRFGTESG